MELLQQPNHAETTTLSAELSTYGLSPKEWNLKKENYNIYRIENKTEPEFCFRGKIKITNGKEQWQSITLASV